MKRLVWILPLLVLVCVSWGCTHLTGLEIGNSQGKMGDEISLTISIHHAPNDVNAFGFDVFYDTIAIRYLKKYTKGKLTKNLEFFGVNEIEPGRVRIGGFTIKNKIKSGESGSIVSLNFKVIGSGDTRLTIKNLVDDIKGWEIKEGSLFIKKS
jgi:hypothetical protein